jgi:hypothetical protein
MDFLQLDLEIDGRFRFSMKLCYSIYDTDIIYSLAKLESRYCYDDYTTICKVTRLHAPRVLRRSPWHHEDLND